MRRRRWRGMSGGQAGDGEHDLRGGLVHAPLSGPAGSGGFQFVSDGGGSAGGAAGGEGEGDAESDNRPILISSIDFNGESPELEQLARSVVFMKPNFSYTIKAGQPHSHAAFTPLHAP